MTKFRFFPAILPFILWSLSGFSQTEGTAAEGAARYLDFSIPVQEQYQDWPPDELVERSYWFPFSERAFFRASLFGKPVFLFIDSRWNAHSHRVRRDLLEDPEVLRRLNEGYITVYVNGDERPDIKERYQTGTMPVMSLLLPTGNPMITRRTTTGDPRPITIGAVDKDRMLFLLEQGQLYYRLKPRSLTHIGMEWTRKEAVEEDPIPGEPTVQAESRLLDWIQANWDRDDGGFGLAPKYVLPGLIRLARLHRARGDGKLSELFEPYLPSLVRSPLHDKVHGGIHRIAGAPQWGEIQYEKLLDRNALFLDQLVLAWTETGSELFRGAAEDTAGFILGTLAAPEGWFYLAQTGDFGSEDGGGYWNDPARKENVPSVDRLVLSGPVLQASAALLRAGAVLDEPAMVEAGTRAIDAVLKAAYEPGRGIRHELAPVPSRRLYLKTQADAAFSLLDAYESTGKRAWLETARDLVDLCRNNLRLPGEDRFIDSLPDPEPIGLMGLVRHPLNANIQLARAMIRLSLQEAGPEYRREAEGILSAYAGGLAIYRAHGIPAAVALEELSVTPVKITLYGDPNQPGSIALRQAALGSSAPYTVLLQGKASEDGYGDPPRAEVARGEITFTVTDPSDLLRRLNRMGGEAS